MRSLFNKLFIIIITLFMMSPNVYAQNCSYEDRARLNELASKVTINYEIIEEEEEVEFKSPDTGEILKGVKVKDKFRVSIYNITDELYVTETNDEDFEERYIISDMTENGVYSFNIDNFANIVKYTYRVRSAHEDCYGNGLDSFSFIKPKYNMYSQYGICEGNENIPYCQKYVTEDLDISPPELLHKVSEIVKKEEAEKEKKDSNKVVVFLKDNYIYFIGGTVIIAGVVVGYIIVRKRREL